ncbi:glutaredoxin family protein [Cytobacillus purgationiresistens]|uniref:Glutaredoxin n=1 Tax=Cytobacillus purgationiresistens TaxID=863449 RepID=A0ABU0ADK1_9BACI|nr:glutaredoxin family protein [Cytobacillus purgationiresistens]MDQ0268175.1 glutaredoxin [Cytobacillus purgationiresistens]
MSNSLSIIVWSKDGCHFCEEVKQYLDEKEIDYQTIDVTHHEDRRDILELKYGVRHVPVIEVGSGNHYQGITELGTNHIEKALNQLA